MQGTRNFMRRVQRLISRKPSSPSDAELANLQRTFNPHSQVKTAEPVIVETPSFPVVAVEPNTSDQDGLVVVHPADEEPADICHDHGLEYDEVSKEDGLPAASELLYEDIKYLAYCTRRRIHSESELFPEPEVPPTGTGQGMNCRPEDEVLKAALLLRIVDIKGKMEQVARGWEELGEDIEEMGYPGGDASGEQDMRFAACRNEAVFEASVMERNLLVMERAVQAGALDLGVVSDRLQVFQFELDRLNLDYANFWADRLVRFRELGKTMERREPFEETFDIEESSNGDEGEVEESVNLDALVETPRSRFSMYQDSTLPRGFRQFSRHGIIDPQVVLVDSPGSEVDVGDPVTPGDDASESDNEL